MFTHYKIIDNRIYLIVEQQVWGEMIEVLRRDVTDEILPIAYKLISTHTKKEGLK